MTLLNVLQDDIGFVQLVDSMGSDNTVVDSARVSFSRMGNSNEQADIRLLKYLASHGHWSPFAHAQVSVRIKAPISMQRQWFKHRVGVENNSESTRYVKIKPEFYIPKQLRLQSKDKKQGSEGILEEPLNHLITTKTRTMYENIHTVYTSFLELGIATEQARDMLPLATYTSWISTMSLYAAWRIYRQRTHDGAQWEIEQYALALEKIVEPLFPFAWQALKEFSK